MPGWDMDMEAQGGRTIAFQLNQATNWMPNVHHEAPYNIVTLFGSPNDFSGMTAG